MDYLWKLVASKLLERRQLQVLPFVRLHVRASLPCQDYCRDYLMAKVIFRRTSTVSHTITYSRHHTVNNQSSNLTSLNIRQRKCSEKTYAKLLWYLLWCWLFSKDYELAERSHFLTLSVDERWRLKRANK